MPQKRFVATGILVFDFELFIGVQFPSILYVSVALSVKAGETKIKTVYRAHASGMKSKRPADARQQPGTRITAISDDNLLSSLAFSRKHGTPSPVT